MKSNTNFVCTQLLHRSEVRNGQVVPFEVRRQPFESRFQVYRGPFASLSATKGAYSIVRVGTHIIRCQSAVEPGLFNLNKLVVVRLILLDAEESSRKVQSVFERI